MIVSKPGLCRGTPCRGRRCQCGCHSTCAMLCRKWCTLSRTNDVFAVRHTMHCMIWESDGCCIVCWQAAYQQVNLGVQQPLALGLSVHHGAGALQPCQQSPLDAACCNNICNDRSCSILRASRRQTLLAATQCCPRGARGPVSASMVANTNVSRACPNQWAGACATECVTLPTCFARMNV